MTFFEQEPAILGMHVKNSVTDCSPNDAAQHYLVRKFDSEAEIFSIAWNVVHDIYLGEKSLAAIESESEILLTLSKSLETWSTSSFGHFRIINVETLETCREIWKQYHDYATSPTTHRPLLNKVVQTMSSYENTGALPVKTPKPRPTSPL